MPKKLLFLLPLLISLFPHTVLDATHASYTPLCLYRTPDIYTYLLDSWTEKKDIPSLPTSILDLISCYLILHCKKIDIGYDVQENPSVNILAFHHKLLCFRRDDLAFFSILDLATKTTRYVPLAQRSSTIYKVMLAPQTQEIFTLCSTDITIEKIALKSNPILIKQQLLKTLGIRKLLVHNSGKYMVAARFAPDISIFKRKQGKFLPPKPLYTFRTQKRANFRTMVLNHRYDLLYYATYLINDYDYIVEYENTIWCLGLNKKNHMFFQGQDGDMYHSLATAERRLAVAFSTRLGQHNIHVFDLEKHQNKGRPFFTIYTDHEAPIRQLAISPMGTSLIALSEDSASLWQLENGYPVGVKVLTSFLEETNQLGFVSACMFFFNSQFFIIGR